MFSKQGNIMNMKQTKKVNKNASLAVSFAISIEFKQSLTDHYSAIGCTRGPGATRTSTETRTDAGKCVVARQTLSP